MVGVEGAVSVQSAFFEALRSGSAFRRSGSAAAGADFRDVAATCAGF